MRKLFCAEKKLSAFCAGLFPFLSAVSSLMPEAKKEQQQRRRAFLLRLFEILTPEKNFCAEKINIWKDYIFFKRWHKKPKIPKERANSLLKQRRSNEREINRCSSRRHVFFISSFFLVFFLFLARVFYTSAQLNWIFQIF